MGKHEAADDSTIDPLIAEALTRRATDTVGAPRHGEQSSAPGEGEVGWPAEPPVEDGGLGWPQRAQVTTRAQESERPTEDADDVTEPSRGDAPRSAPRRGWRRLLAFSA